MLSIANGNHRLSFDSGTVLLNGETVLPAANKGTFAGFTYYDRLLLGQYPTGEVFAFDGETVERIEGWPPVMKGVSGSAREAQTIVLYGGELYVGVLGT